jgi:hypothetical protein
MGRLILSKKYRRTQYTSGNGIAKITIYYSIVGVNFNFMFAYTYSHVAGAVKFDDYHQITLGINLFCKPVKYECNCSH